MTTPINNQGAVYGDFAGLEKLKSGARAQDAQALRQVAQQFESLFARMMLKSMRKAIGKDPIFGSDQEQMYQGMFDDQLSVELTKGRGLGLADMLMRQLRGGAQSTASSSSTARAAVTSSGGATHAGSARTPSRATASSPPIASASERAQFVRDLWPQAQQAAQQLGVHPVGLIAQAALESNWGKSVPRSSGGTSSHNLFGVKASGAWAGDSVASTTREYVNGGSATTTAAFRAYNSPEAGLQDYVALLSSNPRYRAALNSGSNIGAFASALQRGGYATDPDYAGKVSAVARQVASLVPQATATEIPVKFADNRPLTAGTAAL